MTQGPLVLYHDSCMDGFTAAWVAYRRLGDKASYLAVQHGGDPVSFHSIRGRTVYILDFSYERAMMEAIIRAADAVVVLDHHKTAKAELTGLEDQFPDKSVIRFDMDKSGARLAWEFFNVNTGDPSPWLVDYTEDRDLWRWKLPHSREVNATLASYPKTFEQWEYFHDYGDIDAILHRLWEEGSAIIRYQDQLVESACRNAAEITFCGYKVLAVNATCLISEICGKLAENRPFGASYFIDKDGKQIWSLRSREGGIDVSEIARRFGGGGHAAAAGFQQPHPWVS